MTIDCPWQAQELVLLFQRKGELQLQVLLGSGPALLGMEQLKHVPLRIMLVEAGQELQLADEQTQLPTPVVLVCQAYPVTHPHEVVVADRLVE